MDGNNTSPYQELVNDKYLTLGLKLDLPLKISEVKSQHWFLEHKLVDTGNTNFFHTLKRWGKKCVR